MTPVTWIIARPAAERITGLLTGQRNLLDAITASGGRIIMTEDAASLPDADLITEDEPVVVYGGHRFLEDVVRIYPHLERGVYHGPEVLGSVAVTDHLGEMCLNHGARLVRREDITRRLLAGERVFARPALCEKAFPGKVWGPKDVETSRNWSDVDIIMNEPVSIIAEYRFVVVAGEIVTGSQYARGGRTDIRSDTDPVCRDMAAEAVSLYAPCDAFICDVAETEDGPKIVEYNSFSAAGLYACDGGEIVRAMGEMVREKTFLAELTLT